jgi:hypothetical protein
MAQASRCRQTDRAEQLRSDRRREGQLCDLFLPNSAGLGETQYERWLRVQRCAASPISRRSFSSGSGLPFLPIARRIAVSKRCAFLGDRKRCAVSISPANSSAGTMATFLSPLRTTITISRSSATRSRTEARLWRRLVYVVSVIFCLYLHCTGLLYVLPGFVGNHFFDLLRNRARRGLG